MKNGLEIQYAKIDGKELKDLTYSQARGLEHEIYKRYVKKVRSY